MDNRIQLRKFFVIAEHDRSQAFAINTRAAIAAAVSIQTLLCNQNFLAESRDYFLVTRLPGLHDLMRDAVRLNYRKAFFVQHRRNRGFAARDAASQSVAQHFQFSARRTPEAVCRTCPRTCDAASPPSPYCSSAS